MSAPGKPLFIFEMANNHQGSVEHGELIIRAMREIAEPYADRFDFAMKFQYRDLETFIHPGARGRDDIKNVKRFEDTRLSPEQFTRLLRCVRKNNFLAICTPFDETSAFRIREEEYDCIKIASCSFGDWPLMEAVARTELPVIASGAGADMNTVRDVVAFFRNRERRLSLMHCVGEYPTPNIRMQMNQLDLYRREFPELVIGFSTHESPENLDPVKAAVAKGARIFERHVGVAADGMPLNGYSSDPEQAAAWLKAAADAFDLCGLENGRYVPSEKEAADLAALRRGAFVRTPRIDAGAVITADDVYFAFPCRAGQLVAQDFSKFNRIHAAADMQRDEPVLRAETKIESTHALVRQYVNRVRNLLRESGAVVPVGSPCEISCHYGLECFEKTGMTLISCVNREYCKKLLVLLPGQSHPAHHHIRKEETFFVLHGDLAVTCGDEYTTLAKGDTMVMERNRPHSFHSRNGCVFEEISSSHFAEDSYYEEEDDFVSPRKISVFLTKEVLG